MNKYQNQIYLLFIFLSCSCCGQTKPPGDNYLEKTEGVKQFLVDTSITDEVKENVEYISGEKMGTMLFNIYANDTLERDGFGHSGVLEFFETEFTTDTLTVLGYHGFLSFTFNGYELKITKTGYSVTHYTRWYTDGDKIHYSKNEWGKYGTQKIVCTNSSLRLNKKPTFAKGEKLYGIVELESADYFKTDDDYKTMKKFRYRIKGYFTTSFD